MTLWHPSTWFFLSAGFYVAALVSYVLIPPEIPNHGELVQIQDKLFLVVAFPDNQRYLAEVCEPNKFLASWEHRLDSAINRKWDSENIDQDNKWHGLTVYTCHILPRVTCIDFKNPAEQYYAGYYVGRSWPCDAANKVIPTNSNTTAPSYTGKKTKKRKVKSF